MGVPNVTEPLESSSSVSDMSRCVEAVIEIEMRPELLHELKTVLLFAQRNEIDATSAWKEYEQLHRRHVMFETDAFDRRFEICTIGTFEIDQFGQRSYPIVPRRHERK